MLSCFRGIAFVRNAEAFITVFDVRSVEKPHSFSPLSLLDTYCGASESAKHSTKCYIHGKD